MKQIFTLITVAVFCTSVHSQTVFSESFENANNTTALTAKCWILTGFTDEADGVTAKGIASGGASTSSFATPYFDFSGSNTISFQYKIDNPLSNNATRELEICSFNKAGSITVLSSSAVLDKSTLKKNNIYSLSATIATTNVLRIFVRVTAKGDGNTNVIIDNFTISGSPLSYHYGASPCNSAPTAANDNFSTVSVSAYSGNLFSNDSDPNTGESFTATLVSGPPSAAGVLTLSANGNFTFTPAGSFTGGAVTFSYMVTDDGYGALSSNVATATINYPYLTPLPVRLGSFSGNLVGAKAQVKWTVMENESGNFFGLEKSSDGQHFTGLATIMSTGKAGTESYVFMDVSELSAKAYYRLKLVNKDNSVSYSSTIALVTQPAENSNSLHVLQNPVQVTLALNYTAARSGIALLNIYNLSGGKVSAASLNLQAGNNAISLSVGERLTTGVYVLEIVSGNERSIARIIKN